jgi:[acyl-carrier-protein] S-malonyltransferase
MNEVVLLFSGQGAQRVGMGRDFAAGSAAAAGMLAHAQAVLGYDLGKVMAEGPAEELTRTSRCQPALYLQGLMALALLRERVPNLKVAATAGLSLGEFTAHAAAGTFSLEDGLRLVARRGELMEEACEATAGAMAAMIGGEEEAVRELAQACGVDVANLNAPGQIVLSGSIEGIDHAVEAAKDAGIRRAIKLDVAGAYHSRLMAGAQEKLALELARVAFQPPQVPVICNFGACPVSAAAEVREMLEKQVTGSVRWTESMRFLLDRGHRNFIELGPGKVLAGLMGKIEREAIVHSVEDESSLAAAVEALQGA